MYHHKLHVASLSNAFTTLPLIIVFFTLSFSQPAQAIIKTPSDVYAYGILLKQEVEYLRKQQGIQTPFPKIPKQQHKQPRHVIQKALEILHKVNLYRQTKGYGKIYIPPYPSRNITPQDVFDIVKRLNEEVIVFIQDKKFLNQLKLKKFRNKVPNDVYQLLWSISLAFDSLLGIHGYTPTDVYTLAQTLLKNIKFLAKSQNQLKDRPLPPYKPDRNPNHALYKSYELLKKIALSEKKLWISPTDTPEPPQKVITPTEVYDSVQYNLAELQRIKYRLGLERYFEPEILEKRSKTPSDVVQLLEHAIEIYPDFQLKQPLIQYPTSSLKKDLNDVFSVINVIEHKIIILKRLRGIGRKAKNPPIIYGLKPIHVYQKALEATEKTLRLKETLGFYPSQVPAAPFRRITPTEIYELALRLDGALTLILKKEGYQQVKEYIYLLDKPIFNNKTPSDLYHKLWLVSNELDILLAQEYTPTESYRMAQDLQQKIHILFKLLQLPEHQHKSYKLTDSKTPKDVFKLTIEIFNQVKRLQARMNMEVNNIIIPEESLIKPNTVYNALRIVNAAITESLIKLSADDHAVQFTIPQEITPKTPTDVFKLLLQVQDALNIIFDDESYTLSKTGTDA